MIARIYKSPLSIGALLFVLLLAAPACRTKSGCPANADMAPKTNRKGEYKSSKRKGDKGLFPKSAAKKVGVKS